MLGVIFLCRRAISPIIFVPMILAPAMHDFAALQKRYTHIMFPLAYQAFHLPNLTARIHYLFFASPNVAYQYHVPSRFANISFTNFDSWRTENLFDSLPRCNIPGFFMQCYQTSFWVNQIFHTPWPCKYGLPRQIELQLHHNLCINFFSILPHIIFYHLCIIICYERSQI
mmetsp:Transcript_40636/g.85349  ORF Transcript_40636/g.85349 Transcript_40636/m.85349 type:complete len:170 (+) Transcript_40636:49-558(+)